MMNLDWVRRSFHVRAPGRLAQRPSLSLVPHSDALEALLYLRRAREILGESGAAGVVLNCIDRAIDDLRQAVVLARQAKAPEG